MEDQAKELEQAWDTIRAALGPQLGGSLDHARSWIGDEAYLVLSNRFSAGEVIVCCGIQSAAELAGITIRKGSKRDQRLNTAVSKAHTAMG